MSENDIKIYINKNISNDVINIFKKHNKGDNKIKISEFLIKRIEELKKIFV